MGDEGDGLAELLALRDGFEKTPGRILGRCMESLHRTFRVFDGNWAELEVGLHRFKADPDFALDLIGPGGKMDPFLLWLDRPLHNFTASVKTLIDHTRRVARRSLPAESGELAEYEARVKDVFAESPQAQFVEDLRDYLLHNELPSTGGRVRGDAKGVYHEIILPTASIQSWKGWTARGRKFIDEAGDAIDLHRFSCGTTTRLLSSSDGSKGWSREQTKESLQTLSPWQIGSTSSWRP